METASHLPQLLSLLALVGLSRGWMIGDVTSGFRAFGDSLKSITDKMDNIKTDMKQLSRQVMLNQYNSEERIRTEGGSGIKQVRLEMDGPYSFYHATHNSRMFQATHDHSEHMRTLGMGEVVAVLNGVEFRTRHNDYKLVQPSTTSDEYGATENIDFPPVPPQVLAKTNFTEQVSEMIEWFRAFKEQDYSVRDYRKYFRPVLCYLEGAWTMENENSRPTEPFESDRHHLDASSWFDLAEKSRFNSMSGSKDLHENLAHLPTTIVSVDKATGDVTYAQWNYRILCHPLSMDLPFRMFKPLDDYSNRLHQDRSWDKHLNSRSARFTVSDQDYDAPLRWTMMDAMMKEVRGKDNIIKGEMPDMPGLKVYSVEEEIALDMRNYSRQFRFEKAGAMGIKEAYRGFSDPYLFVAKTNQSKVAPFSHNLCSGSNCVRSEHRFSYAIPLEIVFLTPLFNWNPRNLPHFEDEKEAKGQNFEFKGWQHLPFKGTWTKTYYRTPEEFFKTNSRNEVNQRDPADTTPWSPTYIEDADGVAQKVKASGTRVFTDVIANGVGQIRLRWPISPIHGEEGTAFKETVALRQALSNAGFLDGRSMLFSFNMSTGDNDHTHEFRLSPNDIISMKDEGERVHVTTNYCKNHAHRLRLKFQDSQLQYDKCDDSNVCFDNHDTVVISMQTVPSLNLVNGQPVQKSRR